MKKSLAFPLLLTAVFGMSAPALSAQSLLVANQHDHTISVIDPAAGRQIATITEGVPGEWVHEITTSADGRTAYAPVYGNSGVGRPGLNGQLMLVIDVPSRKVIGKVDFGHGIRPHLPVLDQAHHLLYVTTELDDAVTVIDPRTLKILGEVPTGQKESHMLAISHDGRFGYTANVGPGTVSVLDLPGRRTLAVIPVSGEVQRISITPNDRLVFTSDQTQPRLAVIDTATRKVKTWVSLPGLGYGTAVTRDGKWLIAAIPSKNEVAVVDLAAMRVARTVSVAEKPQEVLIRPDDRFAYVSCAGSGQVAAINLADWKTTKLIQAGGFDDGLAWAR